MVALKPEGMIYKNSMSFFKSKIKFPLCETIIIENWGCQGFQDTNLPSIQINILTLES